jgi:transposase
VTWCAPGKTCAATSTRARQRLSHMLRRRGLRFAGPGANWTLRHRAWLRAVDFDDRASRVTFADYLAAVDALEQRRGALEGVLAELAPESPFAETIARLRCFRGIDLLAAAGLCAEIGDFARFGHPRQLAAYLGLVPSEHTSDEKRRQGQITKAGPKHSRRLLVEAAKHSWRRPRVSEQLRRRQEGQDPRVCQVAWRAQRRLHRQWHKLASERGKPANVATVACARELSAFVWEAATMP